MSILYPTAQTRNFYERNSITRVLYNSQQLIGPHALTVRATYTVPAGRRAVLTATHLWKVRNTAAAPIGEWRASLRLTVNAVQCTLRSLSSWDNTLLIPTNQDTPEAVFLNAGDIIDLLTFDGSTGGTCSYVVGASYVEFDA